MHIVLDAMGSDTHPEPEIQAAAQIVRQWPDVDLWLTGPEELLKSKMRAITDDLSRIHIVHAPEVLEMTDKPSASARRKAQNSMAVGMDLLKQGDVDAFVTAGNTGGAMANGLFRLGRIQGVKRPALSALFPVKGGYTVVLDIGANADCKPEYLLQFALMGAVYAEAVLNKPNPRVGLISNGEESGKGNSLVKETYPLLEQSGLNFIGNVEGKELFAGEADVVVMDGFTGNVLLKSSEAVAKLLTDVLREELTATPLTTLGALLAKPAFRKLKNMLDPSEVGAAPLLGLDGLVFVGHGRSDARAILNAIGTARQAVAADLLNGLRETIQSRLTAEIEA